MNKTLENLKETLEDEIKKITKKGDITPSELESVQKAVCTIDMIKKMMNGGQSDGMMMGEESYGYSGYSPQSHHAMPYHGRSYNRSYGDNYSYGEYYNDPYGGESHRRGRSPVTGRYISRGTDYDMGYSGHSIQDRMVARLESMMDEAKTEYERQMVSEWINRLVHSAR